MQNNNQKNQSLDDDILQCKADLRAVIKSSGQSDADDLGAHQSASQDQSNLTGLSLEEEDIFLEAELNAELDEDDSAENVIPLSIAEQSDVSESTSSDQKQQAVDNNDKNNGTKEFNSQSEAVTSEKSHADSETNEILQNIGQLSQESNSFKSQLEQEKTNRQNLQNALEKLEKELQEKIQLTEEQKEKIESFEKQLQSARESEGEKASLKHHVQDLQSENQEFIAKITEQKSRLEELQNAEIRSQNLRSSLEDTESALSEQKALLQREQEMTNKLQEELSSHNEKTQALSEELAAKEKEIAQLKSENSHLQQESQHIHEHKENELSTMAEELKESKAQYYQLHDKTEQMLHEYEAFQTQTSGEIHLLTEKHDLLKNENQGLAEEINRLQAEKQDIQNTSKKLQDTEYHLENVYKELEQERALSEKLRDENEGLTTAVSEISQEKEEFINRLESLESAEGRLRKEIHQLQNTAEANHVLHEELAEAKRQIDLLKDQNQSLEKQLYDVEQAIPVQPEFTCQDTPSSVERPAEYVGENDDIPVFNLADQIMEEHRRSVAGRRHRVEPTAGIPQDRSVKDVIQQYIPVSHSKAAAQFEVTGSDRHPWIDQSLTPFQQEILREIVQNDMKSYSHRNFSTAGYSSMHN